MAGGQRFDTSVPKDPIRLRKRALVLESELNRLRLAAEWRILRFSLSRLGGIPQLLVPGVALGGGWRFLRPLLRRGMRRKEEGSEKKGWIRTLLPAVASVAIREIPRWIRQAKRRRGPALGEEGTRLLKAPSNQ